MKHRNDFQISLRLQEADGDEFYKVDKPISAYSVFKLICTKESQFVRICHLKKPIYFL